MRESLDRPPSQRFFIRLKLWRLQKGLTQNQAARVLHLGASSFALLESGRLQPTRQQRRLLSAHFGDQVETLFEPVCEQVEAKE
jgi:transcriptional regulator with XRE-family HTH domain